MLGPHEFHPSSRSKPVFLRNSYPNSNSDLLSPGLWKILQKYFTVFRYILPCGILLQERKMYLAKSSILKLVIIKVSSVLLMAYTFFTFVLITQKLRLTQSGTTSDALSMERFFVMFYIIFLFPAIIPTSIIISFYVEPICQIVNGIAKFQDRIKGT